MAQGNVVSLYMFILLFLRIINEDWSHPGNQSDILILKLKFTGILIIGLLVITIVVKLQDDHQVLDYLYVSKLTHLFFL